MCLHVQWDNASFQSDPLSRQAGKCCSSVALPYVSQEKEQNKLSHRKIHYLPFRSDMDITSATGLALHYEKEPTNPIDLVLY